MSTIDLQNPTAVAAAADALRRGHLVVFPTDTVYGLAADPRIDGARERLIAAKGRDEGKPIAFLAPSAESIETFGVRMNAQERRLAERFWPGPLTLILQMQSAPEQEEGFRVPNHPFVLSLLADMQTPLLVTSANRSGGSAATSAGDAIKQLERQVALFVDGGQSPGGDASSVVRASGSTLELLREEALSMDTLKEALRQ